MINGVSAEQAVINQVFEKLPEVKSKKEYTLKNGESLWGLAKQELGGKNLTNREIRDYMLLIAKLNGLDTVEKMNGLMANQKIYLPELTGKLKNSVKESKNSIDKTVDALLNTLKNDKSVHVKGSMFGAMHSNLYHIFKEKTYSSGYKTNESPVLSFVVDREGSVQTISTDDTQDIFAIRYDYDIDKKGNVILPDYPAKKAGNLDKTQKESLFGEVQKLYDDYNKQPKRYY